LVSELEDWSSLWGDLLHVDMLLLARQQFADEARNVFARRGLWEAAVTAYGRTSTGGQRQKQIHELVKELGEEATRCLAAAMKWRDKHAAHRVDPKREKVEVRVILDPDERRVKRVAIRVAPTLGPEEEEDELATTLANHVKTLRDLVWEQRLAPLEHEVIAAYESDVERLLARAALVAPATTGFAIDISPSSRDGY
jgi:hypothetical protein